MDTETIKSQLTEWLNRGKYPKNWADHMAVVDESEKDDCVKIALFTDNNTYIISATIDGYLGCMVTSRKPLAGETWMRGSDLADGKFGIETWTNILSDIVSHELVATERPVREMFAERKAS